MCRFSFFFVAYCAVDLITAFGSAQTRPRGASFSSGREFSRCQESFAERMRSWSGPLAEIPASDKHFEVSFASELGRRTAQLSTSRADLLTVRAFRARSPEDPSVENGSLGSRRCRIAPVLASALLTSCASVVPPIALLLGAAQLHE